MTGHSPFWVTLRGLADRERSGRIRLGVWEERLVLVVDGLLRR